MKQLVIFDCDGVIVDSEVIMSRIDAKVLTELGYPITVEETLKKFTGISIKTACQMIWEETGKNLLEILSSQEPNILKAFEKELMPLVNDVLVRLQEMRISRCVASSSSRHRVIQSLKLTDQLKFFSEDSIFTSQQVSRGKPAPDLFLFAASQMGFAPKNCIVVEDSIAGVEAAKAAEMKVIGFLGGSHTHYEWYKEKMSLFDISLARNASELLEQLQKLLTF